MSGLRALKQRKHDHRVVLLKDHSSNSEEDKWQKEHLELNVIAQNSKKSWWPELRARLRHVENLSRLIICLSYKLTLSHICSTFA